MDYRSVKKMKAAGYNGFVVIVALALLVVLVWTAVQTMNVR